MVYEPALLDELEQLDGEAYDLQVFRHMFNELPPERANSRGARWNPPGVSAIYASRERSTAIAEAEWAISVQPLRPSTTRQLYKIDVSLTSALNLTHAGLLEKLGIGEAELTGIEHGPCQMVGGAAYWLGHDAILVPSARAPGANVVIFADRLDVDASFEVVSREDIAAS